MERDCYVICSKRKNKKLQNYAQALFIRFTQTTLRDDPTMVLANLMLMQANCLRNKFQCEVYFINRIGDHFLKKSQGFMLIGFSTIYLQYFEYRQINIINYQKKWGQITLSSEFFIYCQMQQQHQKIPRRQDITCYTKREQVRTLPEQKVYTIESFYLQMGDI